MHQVNPETELDTQPFADIPEKALFDFLDVLGVKTQTYTHPPVRTVAESETVKLDIAGAHTKNLFLKDRDGRLVLISAKADSRVALNKLHRTLGLQRLSFAPPEILLARLGVTPGSVSGFCLINDRIEPTSSARVRFILDRNLQSADLLNFHPLRNDMTTSIRREDFFTFCHATGHEIECLDLDGL
ncbi:MAG: prolyl-tRNA synthetase associated domain-containing protein [Alphaproteobacteria bacterium]|nr:prolyl-tRNA synthetase associated domain-containing protein [Alphaproteobacteria bacterium]